MSDKEYDKIIVRIKNDYGKVCSFLEFYANTLNINSKEIYDTVFLFSLDKLYNEGLHYEINNEERREPKGFRVTPDTKKTVYEYYDKYKDLYKLHTKKKLVVADFIQILLYIYCLDLKGDSKKYLEDMNINWGIKNI